MKTASSILLSIALLTQFAAVADSIHEFTAKDIAGEDVSLKDYVGKVLLIVNVASVCGYTDQYANMENIYRHFKDAGLVVMGFPSNDYGGQEPGSNAEIQKFCQANYAVSFPMFAKVTIDGENQIPLFKFLTEAENPDGAGRIGWNFEKILVGKDGKVLRRFKSHHEPDGPEIVEAVRAALGQK